MKEQLCKSFNKAIETIAKEKGLTLRQIAHSAGFTDSAFVRYRNGDRVPNAEAIYAICSNYNISADFVLGLTDKKGRIKK